MDSLRVLLFHEDATFQTTIIWGLFLSSAAQQYIILYISTTLFAREINLYFGIRTIKAMRATRTAIMVKIYFFVHPVLQLASPYYLMYPFIANISVSDRQEKIYSYCCLQINSNWWHGYDFGIKLSPEQAERPWWSSSSCLIGPWIVLPSLIKLSHFVVPTNGTRSMDWMELFFRNQDHTFYVYML